MMSIAIWKPRCLAVFAVILAVGMLPSLAAAQNTATGERPVTFTKDVAPILQRSCVTCHRPGDIAPMSLLTYSDARPWARAIKTRVAAREMPPWHIDRTIGIQKFKNDRSLSDEEIATIVKWVDSGAPQGNPADMPSLRAFTDATKWQIGEPDLVVKFPAITVPATGPDFFPSVSTMFNLTEDRYIKAIQTRPVGQGSQKVIHHAGTSAVDPDAPDRAEDQSDGGQFLVEYASGKGAEMYPPDSGVLLKAGKKAREGFHLHSIGEEVKAEVEVGLTFHPKGTVPKHIRWTKQLAPGGGIAGAGAFDNNGLDIPAGAIVRQDGYTRLNKAARITAFQPHMHIRGKYECLELIYPGQPTKTEVVSCAHWNYNWHMIYNYADDVAPLAPAGTLLHLIMWHDNSAANKFNPDPRNWVGFGGRTIDEMGFAWIGWYDMTDEEYKAELAVRKELQKKVSN